MRSTVARGVYVSLVLSWAAGGVQAAEVFTKEMLQPQGQYYQATVPDTLDLAERAKLSVHGLTSFLDATTGYAPWGHFAVDSSRPALLDRAGGWPNWGKIAEATAKMRYICGSTEGIDNQLASLRGMVAKLPPSTVPNHGFVPHARVLIALPYEGKVVIHNKMAKSLSVRIPRWVDRSAVKVQAGGRTLTPPWLNRYLLVGSINAGAVITITFPMVTTTEKYSLKWRQTEFWQECSLPHPSWSNDHPAVYTMTFKGNTLVDISPRDSGKGIPLYRRDALRAARFHP